LALDEEQRKEKERSEKERERKIKLRERNRKNLRKRTACNENENGIFARKSEKGHEGELSWKWMKCNWDGLRYQEYIAAFKRKEN
jgi:hypothetical protein